MSSITNCPVCKEGGTRYPTTTYRTDATMRVYALPCYFCTECHNEELVTKDKIQAWAEVYWDTLPKEIRPSQEVAENHVVATNPGFPDYI